MVSEKLGLSLGSGTVWLCDLGKCSPLRSFVSDLKNGEKNSTYLDVRYKDEIR